MWPKNLRTKRIAIGDRHYSLCSPESKKKNHKLVSLEAILVLGFVQHTSHARTFFQDMHSLCVPKTVLPTIQSYWTLLFPPEVNNMIIMLNVLDFLEPSPKVDELNFRRLVNYVRDDFESVYQQTIALATMHAGIMKKQTHVIIANADKRTTPTWK